jgi:hypothetical protein
MLSKLLVAGFLAVTALGCSGFPNENDGENGGELARSGEVALPLTAVNGETNYRLVNAKFTITGAPLRGKKIELSPPADQAVHQERLPVGSYAIVLAEGWTFEKRGTADREWSAVPATLVTPNPARFAISRDALTHVVFGFATTGGQVTLGGSGTGQVEIKVQDCSSYDGVTAALGTFTVDCLGTLDATQYSFGEDGMLHRNFDRCPLDEKKLESIDQILSLQLPRDDLGNVPNPVPYARECIGGRWELWRQRFEESGITQCPMWKREQLINAPNNELVARYAALLPKIDPRQGFRENGERPAVINQLRQNATYFVSFEGQPAPQQCASPAECAAACAGGYPGFVIGADGPLVVTDPPYWELDTDYPDEFGQDPFMQAGVYHPMSFSGPLPGDLFGHHKRTDEACSYYSSGFHFTTKLRPTCVEDEWGAFVCVSVCLP